MDCPLCYSPKKDLRASIPVDKLIETWKRDFNIDIYSEIGEVAAVQLFECQACRLRFFAPNTWVGSSALYAALEKFDWYYMPRKWEHDIALMDLRGYQNILEVGCGIGDFVARMQSFGFAAEGIELNESAVHTAQSRGLPVKSYNLSDLAEEKAGQWDVVCSFQVLEHVADPFDYLDASCALLKPGGRLLIGVPNADSYLRYQFNILDMPPHHLTRWSSAALSRLPDIFPLRLVRIEKEPLAVYHVDGYVATYLQRYFRLFNRHPTRVLAAGLIRRTGLQKHLTGHTIYAVYERV